MATIETERRSFMKYSTLGVLGLVLAGGVGLSPFLHAQETRLRPPGAVDEHTFLGLCIKCGQCLQVCPFHSISLADWSKGAGEGTPYIDANIRGCWGCEAVPCVLACPSGALDHACSTIEQAQMGIAVLESPERCLAMSNTPLPAGFADKMHRFIQGVNNVTPQEQELLKKLESFEGKACTLCADLCPIPNPMSAISMVSDQGGGRRPEIYDGCIGCGACQEVCPTQTPAIVIKPRVTYHEQYEKGTS